MNYEIDRGDEEPHIKEMTEMAIQILRTNENGYFLLVEGIKEKQIVLNQSFCNSLQFNFRHKDHSEQIDPV